MSRKYRYGVVIGRFQPFHEGHKTLLTAAFKNADHVIILCGSAGKPRSVKNPWTVEERRRMIDLALPEFDGRYDVVGISDYAYSDQKWLQEVQKTVDRIVFNGFNDAPNVALFGHNKDDSTFYLKMFPMWDYEEVTQTGPLDATHVRDLYFKEDMVFSMDNEWSKFEVAVKKVISKPVLRFLAQWVDTDAYEYVKSEKEVIDHYKMLWGFSPYPPTFVTADAVVVESGHVALIKRGEHPGKGQWALPGGHLDPKDRTVRDCMVRELYEELGIDAPEKVIRGNIDWEEVFSNVGRDPRGRYVTHGFLVNMPPCPDPKHKLTPIKAADDALEGSATWIPLSQIDDLQDNMFLDHYDIIKKMTGGM